MASRTRIFVLLVLVLLVLGTALASCRMAPPAVVPAPAQADRSRVIIHSYKFVPPRLVVSAGTTVTWENLDYVAHTATGYGTDDPFDSHDIYMQGTYARTFMKPGEYPYLCIPHPGMRGVIVVE